MSDDAELADIFADDYSMPNISLCAKCQKNMTFNVDLNRLVCDNCGKIENLYGDGLTGVNMPNEVDRNIRISKTGNIYIEAQKVSVDEKVIKKLNEINGKLGGKIPDNYIDEIYKVIIDNKHDIVRRGDMKSGIYANYIKKCAIEHGLEISDKEIQVACDIDNKKICDGKRRLRIANLSGYSISNNNLVDDSSRMIDIMMKALNITSSHKRLITHYMILYQKYSSQARELKSRAAGAIYVYIKRKKVVITDEQVSKATGVSISTLSTIYKNTEEVIRKLYEYRNIGKL